MKIVLRTSSAAFEGRKAAEVARILRELAGKLDAAELVLRPGEVWPLYDSNGNEIGAVRP